MATPSSILTFSHQSNSIATKFIFAWMWPTKISSRAALGKAERIAYASSKAGLHGFTKALALEAGAHGITVNAIGPGPIATDLFTKVNPPGAPATQRILETIPLKRMGQPHEVAHMVASLLDERAGYVTGQVMYVCGGMTVGLAS